MLKRLGCLGVLTVCLAVFAPAGASAATVANTNDSGPGSLRQTVEEASPGETIDLPAGSYHLTSGPLVLLESDLAIAGAGAGSTFLSSNGSQLFLAVGEGSLTISGVRFGGTEINSGGSSLEGGLVEAVDTDLALTNDTFTGNRVEASSAGNGGATVEGGLVLAVDDDLSILGTQFAENTVRSNGASGKSGGDIEGALVLCVSGSTTVKHSSVSGNTIEARGGQGPSSSEQQGGEMTGGAVLFINTGSPTETTHIFSSSFGRNSLDARGGPGGSDGTVEGGVLATGSSGSQSLTEDTFADNVVQDGEGEVVGGTLMLLPSGEGPTQIEATTIADNQTNGSREAGFGGMFFSASKVGFADSIISGGGGSVQNQNCFVLPETITSAGHNLDSTDQCGFHGNADQVNTDPQLGPLQNNGGPVETMLPAGSSPVVDKGASLGLSTDARGLPRPVDFPSIANAPGGDGSDIGAVEVQASDSFGFGALKRNKKKGTATLTVNLPAPPNAGTLTLSGSGLKSQTATLTGSQTSISLPVIATGKVLKALKKKGKRAIGITVSLQPPGNAAASQTLKTKLFKKLKKKHHKRKHGKHHKKKR